MANFNYQILYSENKIEVNDDECEFLIYELTDKKRVLSYGE